jgi:hypothetical protein
LLRPNLPAFKTNVGFVVKTLGQSGEVSDEQPAHYLRQLALERDVAVEDVVMDGIVLVLRYYGHAEGLAEPVPQ